MKKTVVELFAGVGGFRIGLNKVQLSNEIITENGEWDVVWANQWEPSTKSQPAFDCYVKRFGNADNHVNKDIATIDVNDIPDHTLLVGGFPCQDYSVARSLSKEKGIEGKKGVLWWEIHRIIKQKKPSFVLLENVDRLLKSPSTQRGRDFGIMLKSFSELGYSVEWRVINASDYGAVQRRRRVFIFAFSHSTRYSKQVERPFDYIHSTGMFAKAFPVDKNYLDKQKESILHIKDYNSILHVSDTFRFSFKNTGLLHGGIISTIETSPVVSSKKSLRQILQASEVDQRFYLNDIQIEKHKYLKGAKRIQRTTPDGDTYHYSEGSMSFPDNLDSPGRTMLTSEGTINRSTHVILDPNNNKLRHITPIESERMNNFPDNWTKTGMTDRQRYFMMGNALVTIIVEKIGGILSEIVDSEQMD